jgi:preprotein translocase subunit SecG
MFYSLLTGLFTVILIVDCLILVLLVLIQLPKKDAGAGVAFGSGATDALFGAGSGNALTNITKWAAGIFFALSLVLGVMNTHAHNQASSNLKDLIKNAPPVSQPASPGSVEPRTAPPAAPSAPISLTTLSSSNAAASNAPVLPPK